MSGDGRRILLVSNRTLKASLMAATLDDAGLDVDTAAGAAAAIELAAKLSYGATLVDLDGLGNAARFVIIELKAVAPRTQLIGFGEKRSDTPTDINLDSPFSAAGLVDIVLASLGLAIRPSIRCGPPSVEMFVELGG